MDKKLDQHSNITNNGRNKLVIAMTASFAKNVTSKFQWPPEVATIVLPEEKSRLHKSSVVRQPVQMLWQLLISSLNKKNRISKDNCTKDSPDGTNDFCEAKVLLMDWTRPEDFSGIIAKLPKLEWLHVLKTGVDHLPIEQLMERGVVVTCIKGVYSNAVAEFVMALIYANFKEILVHQKMTEKNQWKMLWSREIRGKYVLILGTGSIGKAVAELVVANGMYALGVNSDGRRIEPFSEVATLGTMHKLLSYADVIVNCLPSTVSTRYVIGVRELSILKSGSGIINVGRAEAIDPEALTEGLDKDRPAWVALDIDRPVSSLAFRHPKILHTHHSAYTSEEAYSERVKFTEENVRKFITGQSLSGIVDFKKGY